MVKYFIGTSGWHYEHWKGFFYPESLAKSKWLGFYSERFSTVEVNNTFYRLPSKEAFTRWREVTPAEFMFTIKVNRFITHVKRLKMVDEPLEKFLSQADNLGDKLGPLFYQLPPNMKCNSTVLEEFLSILPENYCHIFEFRHASWFTDEIFNLLRCFNSGFCVYDMPGFTCPLVATCDTAYIRFHGSRDLYSSYYDEHEMSTWATNIKRLGQGLSRVFVYFNNDAEGYAIKNAETIRRMLPESS
jgi:uncharacterized protein YecE (DUF72 family)